MNAFLEHSVPQVLHLIRFKILVAGPMADFFGFGAELGLDLVGTSALDSCLSFKLLNDPFDQLTIVWGIGY